MTRKNALPESVFVIFSARTLGFYVLHPQDNSFMQIWPTLHFVFGVKLVQSGNTGFLQGWYIQQFFHLIKQLGLSSPRRQRKYANDVTHQRNVNIRCIGGHVRSYETSRGLPGLFLLLRIESQEWQTPATEVHSKSGKTRKRSRTTVLFSRGISH